MIKEFRGLLESQIAQNKVLVACHRSMCCGNIMENTVKGCIAGWRSGADIVEIDIVRSSDGEYYVLHDGVELRIVAQPENLQRLTSKEIDALNYRNVNCYECGKVERLFELLPALKGKGLINIDRSWRYWNDDNFLERLAKLDMNEQLLLKAPATDSIALDALEKCSTPLLFMPLVYSIEEVEEVLKRNLNIFGLECIFTQEDSQFLDKVWQKKMKDMQIHLWVNAIIVDQTYTLCAYHDDDNAILKDFDQNWGWLIKNGFDLIQTDWTTLLREYIKQNKPFVLEFC